ncbi:MAG: LysM domain-containing protein [Myxococcales bacterium]|nr:LysM domain-containing protein [Myxococcales bacterium]
MSARATAAIAAHASAVLASAVLATAVLAAAVPGLAAAQVSVPDVSQPAIRVEQSNVAGERTYVVEPGDTLWSIAEGLYDEPWYWPSLWSYNPQITNPHLIYAGDLLYLSRKPPQGIAQKALTFAGSRYEGVKSAPTELARRVGYITSRDYRESGTIEASREERNMLGTLDEVYVRFLMRRCREATDKAKADDAADSRDGEIVSLDKNPAEPEVFSGPCVRDADRFTFYRVEREVVHPLTGKVVGFKINFLGEGKVLATARPLATVLLTRAYSEISRGDLVTNVFEPLQLVKPVPNKVELVGTIVDFHHETTAAGAWHYVYIDKGADDNVARGNRFEIMWRGDGLRRAQVKDLRDFPDEQIGIAMVVEAYDRHSLAVMTHSVREIERGMPAVMAKGF